MQNFERKQYIKIRNFLYKKKKKIFSMVCVCELSVVRKMKINVLNFSIRKCLVPAFDHFAINSVSMLRNYETCIKIHVNCGKFIYLPSSLYSVNSILKCNYLAN